MQNLDGKVAPATGASRGIGAEVASSLSDADVKVTVASRRGDDLGLSHAFGSGATEAAIARSRAPSPKRSTGPEGSPSCSQPG